MMSKWPTCLPRPGLPVYPGLVYLFTQAWSTCLPRPGLHVYPGLVNLFAQAWNFFKIWEHPRKHSFFMDVVIYGVPRPRDYHHQIRLEKLVWMNQFPAQTDVPRARISILCSWISKFQSPKAWHVKYLAWPCQIFSMAMLNMQHGHVKCVAWPCQICSMGHVKYVAWAMLNIQHGHVKYLTWGDPSWGCPRRDTQPNELVPSRSPSTCRYLEIEQVLLHVQLYEKSLD